MTSISNITEAPIDLVALIGEFSGNIDFLPAVSEEFERACLSSEAQKIANLSFNLAPDFIIGSLKASLATNEEANFWVKSHIFYNLVVEYSSLVKSHPLLKNSMRIEEVFNEIVKIADSIPHNETKQSAHAILILDRISRKVQVTKEAVV
ncbi:MAG: hypothetical protein PVI40_06890 [Chlamydiota bacterium]|jgi:hypothetical protein